MKNLKLYDEGTFNIQEFFSDELSRVASQDSTNENEEHKDDVIKISGWASRYRTEDGIVVDRDQEVTDTDSMSLTNFLKNPILLYNHNPDYVIGRVVKITKSYEGIFVEAEVYKMSGLEHVYEAVSRQLLKTFSVGFIPRDFAYDETTDVFILKDGDLFELSIVSIPSNAEAIFSRMEKSLRVNKKQFAAQNNLSCDELKGQCVMKKAIEKETDLKVIKSVEEKEPEVVVIPEPEAKVEVKEVVAPKVEVKPQPTPDVITAADLVALLDKRDADKKAEHDKIEAERIAKEQEAIEAEKSKVPTALETLSTISIADLDDDELDAVYEVVASLAEQVERRVVTERLNLNPLRTL
jgi:HK97 family phage prohead protease